METGLRADLHSVFKIAGENLSEDSIWAQDVSCFATAQKRYVLKRETKDGAVQAKSSAFVLGTLANFREDGALCWERREEAWRIGPDLAEDRAVSSSILDLSEPVLQPLPLAHPNDWRALGVLRFSSANPEGIRPFETVLVPVPQGTPRARLVAHYEPNRSGYQDLIFRSSKSACYVVRTPDSLSRPGPKGADAWKAPAFNHLFTPEHGSLLTVAIRLLAEVVGAAVSDRLNGLTDIDFNRVPPSLPDRRQPTTATSAIDQVTLAQNETRE